MLKVQGDHVVDSSGRRIILRGAGLGGWMNMENFITGFPGHEREHRVAMLKVLGPEKYEYFFDRWLYHFFTEADAKYLASLGLNCLRIPFNYRHFEDDQNPRVLKKDGFRHLDRVVDMCAKENIYTILDMHAVPGGQNGDWHSDNATNIAAFWDHEDFQGRTVWLWEQLAAHYKGMPWVAGYNPLNEPADPEYVRLPAFYDRVETAIRKVDPHHILWLDGNTYAMEWKGFEHTLPNCVYSLHDYSTMGFPTGPRFRNASSQVQRLNEQFMRKSDFMRQHRVPIWNGEFGPVYADPREEIDAAVINEERIALLGAQLEIYARHEIHWSIWLYKDIGLQGMVHTSPDSPWNRAIAPFLAKKKATQTDAWGKHISVKVDAVLDPLVAWLEQQTNGFKTMYPPVWDTRRHVTRVINECLLGRALADEFAEIFRDMDKAKLEDMAKSFNFERCVLRETLTRTLQSTKGTL